MSGPASLFSIMARGDGSISIVEEIIQIAKDQGDVETLAVTCPHCLSENTEATSQADQYYCKDCETFFDRPG